MVRSERRGKIYRLFTTRIQSALTSLTTKSLRLQGNCEYGRGNGKTLDRDAGGIHYGKRVRETKLEHLAPNGHRRIRTPAL